jgi:starch synthase
VRARVALDVLDVDGDGREEVVLCNEFLYAVFSPEYGGRLVYLFAKPPDALGGALVIGNPSDDWNLQEEPNRHMSVPPNHPGALGEPGFEQDRYEVSALEAGSESAFVELLNTEEGSDLFGARKGVLLESGATALVVRYQTPGVPGGLIVRACLSPDYYRMLREGRGVSGPIGSGDWRGHRTGRIAVWLGLDPDEGSDWARPGEGPPEVGHGYLVHARVHPGCFHLLVGCGPTDNEHRGRLLRRGREALSRRVPVSGGAGPSEPERHEHG